MQIFPRLEGRFADFVAPARPRNQLWRLALSGPLIVLGFVVGALAGVALLFLLFGPDVTGRILAPDVMGRTPLSIVYILSGFPVVLLSLWAVVRLIHRRTLGSLFGASRQRVLRNALLASVIMTLITGLGTAVTFATASPVQHLPLPVWLGWMGLVLPLIAIQVTTEELLFRGYLQQQLAARFNSPWIWMVLPSALFGSLHYQPALLGDNAWIAVLVTALVGLFAADITARTGNIGAALGLHFVNNFFALCFLSLDGGMSGASLFVTSFSVTDSALLRPMLLADAGSIAAVYLVYLVIVNRRRRP